MVMISFDNIVLQQNDISGVFRYPESSISPGCGFLFPIWFRYLLRLWNSHSPFSYSARLVQGSRGINFTLAMAFTFSWPKHNWKFVGPTWERHATLNTSFFLFRTIAFSMFDKTMDKYSSKPLVKLYGSYAFYSVSINHCERRSNKLLDYII